MQVIRNKKCDRQMFYVRPIAFGVVLHTWNAFAQIDAKDWKWPDF
jgi:hypothetical protein